MAPSASREMLTSLQHLGVLNLAAEPACGLWDDEQAPMQRRLSLETLQLLATESAGLALQVHQQALAAVLNRCVGAVPDEDEVSLPLLGGAQGMGREALVRAVTGHPLSGEHTACLADNWCWPSEASPRLIHALPDWRQLWLPVWRPDQGWQWHRLSREQVCEKLLPHSHGLDELSTYALWVEPAVSGAAVPLISGAEAAARWLRLQAMHTVGLQAISQGAVARAWKLAREQALLRRQGGVHIMEHAAVRLLLGTAHDAVQESAQVLQHIGQSGCVWPDLCNRWRARARCQSSLSAGASAALQVFGGMGYMRDNGMEKRLRDVSHLRQLGGSPAELRLCVAEWDRLTEQDEAWRS